MNQGWHDFVLVDGGKEKHFKIKEMKGLESFKCLTFLTKLVAQTEKIDAAAIKQLIMNLSASGVEVPGVDKERVQKVVDNIKEDRFIFMFDLFKAILAEWNDYTQQQFLDKMFNCITLYEATNTANPFVTLSLDATSTQYIDLYINSAVSIIRLCWEVIRINYLTVFPKAA